MAMSIDVIERQSKSAIGFELCGDFSLELPPQGRIERNLRAISRQVIAKFALPVDQAGDIGGGADRDAIDQHDVQADAQARHGTRPRHRVDRGRRADHEARRAQNAAPMRLLDGGIDRFAETEIVGRDDESVQCASSRRSRMKDKNSTPSRNRRIIDSGLRIISPTIDAIFGARK
jgi:hypothetical protein